MNYQIKSLTNLYLVSFFLLLSVTFCSSNAFAEKKRELVLLNWAEYMDQGVVKDFEKKFNVKVIAKYFETDETRNELIYHSEGKGYDVVVIERARISSYIKRKLIASIDMTQIPNGKYIDKKWFLETTDGKVYNVPYAWGTIGIAYRKDLVSKPITSWKDLLEPGKNIQGKILMIKDSTDVIGAALKALGYSNNSADLKELEEAERLLLKQKPFVKTYSTLTIGKNSQLVTGEIVAAMAWNGDVMVLKKLNQNIEFVIPREGTSMWADSFVIMEKSKNKDLAMAFINFLHEPENAARICKTTMFATPNNEAIKILPNEILENPIIFPPRESIKNLEFNAILSPGAVKKRNSIFSKLFLK